MANRTDKLIVSNINKTLFVIPYYQRGYRWTGKNAKQLLSDLLLFAKCKDVDSEYCLQPIVLQKISEFEYSNILLNEESVIRVVDGQQRLTTLALIIHRLYIPTTWDIYYDTEKMRLSEILNNGSGTSSINDYFRQDVIDSIDEFLSDDDVKNTITFLFLSSKRKISFLEYDVDTPKGEDTEKEGHKTFLRLNDGKTPLTSSELIRALYMVRSSGLSIQQQMEISKEWEIIENCLQDEQFWLMFNARGLEDTPTRIDLLFALVLSVSLKETKANPRLVFEKLEDEEEQYNLEKVWDEVLQTFWWMQSCYADVELCNLLSWIRHYTDISATSIYRYWRKYPILKDFKDCIIKTIQDVKFNGTNLHSLDIVDYNWDKAELRKLFVLLNILDCNKSNERFRFDLFNKCKGWDIEHINSQTPNDFKQDKNKKEWLDSAWKELDQTQKGKFLENFFSEKTTDIEKFCIDDVMLDDFELYATYIVELTQNSNDKIPDEYTNKLGNLALLNLSINRSYKNDIFPLKRKAINNHINKGSEYIPPCTAKAFSKFYTKSASRITSWQYSDYIGYYNVMNERFSSFMEYKVELSDNSKEVENCLKDRKKIITDYSETTTDSLQNQHGYNRFEYPVNFCSFMDTYDVIIPKIQRLYVQGRLDKRGEKCLLGFANALVNSVTTSSPLLLDFVYGIDITGSYRPIFYPLDGQQRLTTLLLLSWLCGISKPEWCFKYESRRSTEVFIKCLLNSNPPQIVKPSNYDELKKIAQKKNLEYPSLCKKYIVNQPWFHVAWAMDPGIKGMIEMLDSLYDKLINQSASNTIDMSKIVFLLNYLDVSKKSYDHIFLKMNSRGRELTEWDNVNAILDEYLPSLYKNTWPKKIQKWYELMWEKMPTTGTKDNNKINRVDSEMLSIVELALDCFDYKYKCTNTYELSKWLQNEHNENDIEKFYRTCEIFFSALEIDKNDKLPFLIPSWSLSKRPRIPDFKCNEYEVVVKFYQPLLVFYASVLSKNSDWIRIIWNIVENIYIDRQSFKQALHLIEELSQNKESILKFLSSITTENIKSCYKKAQPQLQEEIDKSVQIVKFSFKYPSDWDDAALGKWPGWYKVIYDAESKRAFAGAIRFLFHNGQNDIDWNKFSTKWKHADVYFDKNEKEDYYAAPLISALLKRCSKWEQVHDHFIFNITDWKDYVLLESIYAEPLDYILTANDLNVEIADFEEGKVCERIIRDRLFEDRLIKIITTDYRDYRLSSGRYFYGWRKHDGILLDWKTDNPIPEPWENRRTSQFMDMQANSTEITIHNNVVSEEIFFGYTLSFNYRGKTFVWGDKNEISLIVNNQNNISTDISPKMDGKEILSKLDLLILNSILNE